MNPSLPCLPAMSLATAEETTTNQIVRGKRTVIDFWTTRCTRCPQALDDLNEIASQEQNESVRFISICCDKLDGAREIIENWENVDNEPRWNNIQHFFMEEADKEEAKQILGFKSVPFYVVLNEQGEIEEMGNKVDLTRLSSPPQLETPLIQEHIEVTPVKKPGMTRMDSPTDVRGSFDFDEACFDLDF
eukprot:CAMPEP_0198151760 /NCGR_PEP_ID=MMETSP1443-20131203/56989_1 /TAXON_ID=186043 /ORGANISM="Entomoneis sp., Strain CCMP2396" /LENGTH=188 /DNA_ID=CAMNT_0043817543 /DNA_START=80 /DNA_END=649 /DNA_ORIENTATION=+